MPKLAVGALVATLAAVPAAYGQASKPAAPALAAATVGTEAAFAFLGEPGNFFECKLDDRPSALCTSPVRYSSLAPGPHRFIVAQQRVDRALSPLSIHEWTAVAATAEPGAPVDPAEPPLTFDDPLPTDFGSIFGPELGPFDEPLPGEAGTGAGAPAAGTAAPPVLVAASQRRRLDTVLRRGLRVTVRCPSGACRIDGRLTIRPRDARRLGLRLKAPLLVATDAVSGTGRLELRLRPRPRAARVLRRARRSVTLSLRATVGSQGRTARIVLVP